MLQNISEKTKGWIAWVIVGLVALTFSLWGLDTYLDSRVGASRTIAKINGEKISQQVFDLLFERVKREQQIQMELGEIITPEIDAQLRKQTLRELIVTEVLEQDAKVNHMVITPAQAEQAVWQLPVFQENGQFSPERYQQALSSSLFTPQTFLQELQQGMLVNQFRAGLVGSAFTLPKELTQIIALINQRRDFRHLTVPAKQFAAETEPTEAQERDYYQRHETIFIEPEQVSLAYLDLNFSAILAKTQVSEQEMKDYYTEHQRQLESQRQWRVAHILLATGDDEKARDEAFDQANALLVQLQEGEKSFAELAKAYSIDPFTARRGGELPPFSPGTVTPAFEKAVAELAPGEVSPPIITENGIEIIQLIAVETAGERDFEDVKQQVEAMLKQNKAKRTFLQMAEQLADLTFANPESLEEASMALNLPIRTTDFFTAQGENEGLLAEPLIIEAAFSDDVLEEGNNSDVIQLTPERMIVLRIQDHKPVKKIPFAEVQTLIRQQIIAEASAAKAQAIGQTMVDKLKRGESIDELTKAHNLRWKEEKGVTREQANAGEQSIIYFAFQLPRPADDTPLPVSLNRLFNGDAVLIQLMEVHEGKQDSMDREQRHTLRDQLEYARGLLDYELYVQSLMEKAKIKTYE